MPLGTTLFHSPGWNEGKARNGTLGTHRQKRIELRRSGTNRASVWFVSLRSVALHSLGNCRSYGAQKCGGNNYPRACALGFEKVSPLQGFSLSINVSKMILRCIIVGFFWGLRSPRWAHYRNGCVKIGMGVIVRLPWVRSRATASKFKRIMSAFRHDTFSQPRV